LLALIGILVAIGQAHTFPDVQTAQALLAFYTNPFLLLFAFGVAIGYFELNTKTIPVIRFPVSPAFLLMLPVPAALLYAKNPGAGWYGLLSIYSTLVVLLCTFVRNEWTGRIGRVLILSGDSSYSTYLFHPLVIPVLLAIALRVWGSHAKTTSSAMLLVVIFLLAANLAGLLVHFVIERPLIRAFRRFDFGPLQRLKPKTA